jgi:hypothetical protein
MGILETSKANYSIITMTYSNYTGDHNTVYEVLLGISYSKTSLSQVRVGKRKSKSAGVEMISNTAVLSVSSDFFLTR